jgi:hypothetical protein
MPDTPASGSRYPRSSPFVAVFLVWSGASVLGSEFDRDDHPECSKRCTRREKLGSARNLSRNLRGGLRNVLKSGLCALLP